MKSKLPELEFETRKGKLVSVLIPIIRYEELLFSLLGAVVLIIVARMIGLLGKKPRKS